MAKSPIQKRLEKCGKDLRETLERKSNLEGHLRQARSERDEYKYHSEAGRAFKDEVVFLRGIVEGLTVGRRQKD